MAESRSKLRYIGVTICAVIVVVIAIKAERIHPTLVSGHSEFNYG